jgi:glucosamine--fructose-6-phosphate aminotransferase (isomerizing)
MCGLASFIGKSNNQNLSFDLFQKLFVLLEERGADASGYYCCINNSNEFFTDKKSCTASNFIKNDTWKCLKNYDLDLLLIHTRKTSFNSGSPSDNENNHPFLALNTKSALVHNGIIHEYQKLKKQYHCFTECDSEILMRILDCNFEEENYLDFRKKQIKGLLGLIKNSEFTFLLADILSDKKSLWAVKNEHRPLFLIDAKEYLNQYIFVSTVDIWQNAIDKIKDINLNKCKVYFLENNFIINILYYQNDFRLKFFSYNWENYQDFNLIK